MGNESFLTDIRQVTGNEELTPRFLKLVIGTTVGFLIISGIISYVLIFVILGF